MAEELRNARRERDMLKSVEYRYYTGLVRSKLVMLMIGTSRLQRMRPDRAITCRRLGSKPCQGDASDSGEGRAGRATGKWSNDKAKRGTGVKRARAVSSVAVWRWIL